MVLFHRFMSKETLPEISPVRQNVRVGDRLGVRYTGVGSTFNLGEEIIKSESLGAPTFEAVYMRYIKNDDSKVQNPNRQGYVLKITPDRKFIKISIDNPDGEYYHGEFGLGEDISREKLLETKLTIEDDMQDAEIIVIPNFSFQTPSILNSLDNHQIDKYFDEILLHSDRAV